MVRYQGPHVDGASRNQLQTPAGDAAWVGQRAIDVQVAANDGAQVDATQLTARAGRAGQHDPPAATGHLDRLPGSLGRAGELDDQVSATTLERRFDLYDCVLAVGGDQCVRVEMLHALEALL